MTIDVLVLGAGGHAKVVLDSLRTNKDIRVLGLIDINPAAKGSFILKTPILGSEEILFEKYSPLTIQLVNGVGSTDLTTHREKLFNKFKLAGYQFLNVIHSKAYIGDEVSLGEGVQLMSGTTIQPGCFIGDNVVINTNASVDHDSRIGSHVHLAPGVVCCGNVVIGAGTHIGTGAIIKQGVKIGEHCLIAAGAVVLRDILPNSRVAGVPAENME
jgi:sugar O-acyltransferase (sialic acid O-acetyltransferase NeuD family)